MITEVAFKINIPILYNKYITNPFLVSTVFLHIFRGRAGKLHIKERCFYKIT